MWLLLIIFTLLSIRLAFKDEKKRKAANPDDLPYTWGYFWGNICVFLTILLLPKFLDEFFFNENN